jgi:quinohemoprotein ethanol dehydrogenase
VVAGGTAPDLRASTIPLSKPAFTAVVREGGLVSKGMPQFAELSDDELESLRHFIRAKARGVSYVREPPLTAPAVNAK